MHGKQSGLVAIVTRSKRLCLACRERIDGMMQYEHRYADTEFDSVDATDLTLKYAPLLLGFASLDTLEGLLKEYRRIERDTSDNMADKLAAARILMWDAYHLWEHLEHNPHSRQDELRQFCGGEQEHGRAICDNWRDRRLTWGEMAGTEHGPSG